MQGIREQRLIPELREVVVEASLALARLDADRLEELAVSCQALNRGLVGWSDAKQREMERLAREASGEMAIFSRVLEATRSNLEVMNQLRERESGRLEYPGPPGTRSGAQWAPAGNYDGNH